MQVLVFHRCKQGFRGTTRVMYGITFETPIVVKKQHPYRDRSDIIQLFVDKINKEREGTKFKKVTFMAICNKCIAMSDAQLFAFFNDCEKKVSFGKYFFWATKVK